MHQNQFAAAKIDFEEAAVEPAELAALWVQESAKPAEFAALAETEFLQVFAPEQAFEKFVREPNVAKAGKTQAGFPG